MEFKGIQPVGYGALLGIIITSLVAVIAQFVKRDTALRSHIIDDRGKITADTALQLTQALKRLDTAEAQNDLLNNDKTVLVNSIGNIKSELTLLSGLFDQQEANIGTDVIDINSLRRTHMLIDEAISRMRLCISDSETLSVRKPVATLATTGANGDATK